MSPLIFSVDGHKKNASATTPAKIAPGIRIDPDQRGSWLIGAENTVISIEVKESEDFMASLNHALEEKGVKHGAIVSLIGAFDKCVISNMDKNDAFKDHLEEYDTPLEVSGCGYVEEGKPHIHVVASSNNGETYAGHLHSAVISSWFVKLFIIQ